MSVNSENLIPIVTKALGLSASVSIENLKRLTGGASRETWSFDALFAADGKPQSRGLVLRFGTSSYGDVLGASGEAEYELYKTISNSDSLPIPKPLIYIADTTFLGADFFLIERIDHCETSPALLFSDAYRDVARKTVLDIFRLGGKLSLFQWQGTRLEEIFEVPEPNQVWSRQLQYWRQVISDCAIDPQPLVNYLINWLAQNPPAPPERIAVLSGDYRLGNFLYNSDGEVKGWLDWEMGHLGDPMEDLTWALMSNWRSDDGFPGGLTREDLINEWQRSSGLKIDAKSFHWWSLFQHVKAHGIWQAAVKACARNPAADIKHLLIAVSCPILQDRLLIDEMEWAK